jgi:hypothetical protein
MGPRPKPPSSSSSRWFAAPLAAARRMGRSRAQQPDPKLPPLIASALGRRDSAMAARRISDRGAMKILTLV